MPIVVESPSKSMAEFDAVLVPGGGLLGDGTLCPWVIPRLEKAAAIAGGAYIIPLSAGTVHKAPPLDARGFPIRECDAGARYLVSLGYSAQNILVERCSYDTIGNLWFSRLIHVDPLGLRKLALVTSEFHMPRTEAVFRWIYRLAPATGPYTLACFATANEGLPADVLDVRVRKEQQGLASVRELECRIQTVREMHEWMYSEHRAYATSPENADGSGLDGLVLKSY